MENKELSAVEMLSLFPAHPPCALETPSPNVQKKKGNGEKT